MYYKNVLVFFKNINAGVSAKTYSSSTASKTMVKTSITPREKVYFPTKEIFKNKVHLNVKTKKTDIMQTHFFIKPTSFNKTQARPFCKVSRINLPLELRIKAMHKIMKKFLAENEKTIPHELYRTIYNDLAAIRQVTWGVYNCQGQDGREPRKKLLNFQKHQKPLLSLFPHNELLADAFSALEDGVECINERMGDLDIYLYYPK